jgi:hypothetical protein
MQKFLISVVIDIQRVLGTPFLTLTLLMDEIYVGSIILYGTHPQSAQPAKISPNKKVSVDKIVILALFIDI